MTRSMSAAQRHQQSNRTSDGRYAEGSHAEPAVDLESGSSSGRPITSHMNSAEAYRDHVEDLYRQLESAKAQQARHELAHFASNQPDAKYLAVVDGYADDGQPVLCAGGAFGRGGPLLLNAEQHALLAAWEAPRGGSLDDLTVGSFTEQIDLDKVRDWSASAPRATPYGLAGQQADRAEYRAEQETLRGLASDVRRGYPDARFVHVTENDLGQMTYESVTDQNGEVLHESDAGDGFTETMEYWSENLDERGRHWTGAAAETADGVAVDRDRHFGQVQSATLDLDKVDAMSS